MELKVIIIYRDTDLLLRDFQGLQVVANHAQLLLKLHNFAVGTQRK